MTDKTIHYKGIKYDRYGDIKKNRYYRSQYTSKRPGLLHRHIWEDNHGEIPVNHVVHHKDGNTINNNISNLETMGKNEHNKLSNNNAWKDEGYVKLQTEHLKNVRPLTKKWHSSEEGRKWHGEHGKENWANKKFETYKCIACNIEFKSRDQKKVKPKFCSQKCITKLVKEGRNRKLVNCPVCNKEFYQEKIKPVPKTCSYRCGALFRNQK